MFDAKTASAGHEPIHRGTVEGARSTEAVGARQTRQQLQVDLLCKPAKGAIADVCRFVEHSRLQVMCHESHDVTPHIEAVDRMHVQSIKQADSGRNACLFVIERTDATVDEGGGRWLPKGVTHR